MLESWKLKTVYPGSADWIHEQWCSSHTTEVRKLFFVSNPTEHCCWEVTFSTVHSLTWHICPHGSWHNNSLWEPSTLLWCDVYVSSSCCGCKGSDYWCVSVDLVFVFLCFVTIEIKYLTLRCMAFFCSKIKSIHPSSYLLWSQWSSSQAPIGWGQGIHLYKSPV